MKGKIGKRSVDDLKPGQLLADIEIKGFVARCLPSGVVTYGYRYRDRKSGVRRWARLGLPGSITPDATRILGRDGTDRKSTPLNSRHTGISSALFCLKKKT